MVAAASICSVRPPTGTDGGWPTSPHLIIHDNGSFASTNVLNDTMELNGHNFTDLPTTPQIDGIEVALTGLKEESAGSGTLKFTVDLSWDGGSTWTSVKNTDAITTSSDVYLLGGATDDWGHSWTREELVNIAKLRCRIKATGSAILDFPEWRAHYCSIKLYVTDITAITLGVSEANLLSDAVSDQPLALNISEYAAANDSGAAGINSMELRGTVNEEQFLTSTLTEFQTATLQRTATTAMGVTIAARLGPTIFLVSDASVSQEMGPTVARYYQPGVIEWGDITFSGSPGEASAIDGASVRLRNSTLADVATGNVQDLLDMMSDAPFLGATVSIHLMIADEALATGWTRQLLFSGNVTSVSAREEYVDVKVMQEGQEALSVPTATIKEDTFTYGDKEGNFPEQWANTVIPVGYGHFDSKAVKDFANGHPMAIDINGIDVGGVFTPPYLGMKTPLMPVVLGTDLWQQKAGGAPWDAPRLAVFLQGDKRTAPEIEVGTEKQTPTKNLEYRRPLTTGTSAEGVDTVLKYYNIFTWDNKLDRAVAFRTDISTGVDSGHKLRGGAGDLRRLQSDFTDGEARHAFPCFIGRTGVEGPVDAGKDWTGPIQSVAVLMENITPSGGATFWRDGAGIFGGIGVDNQRFALGADPDTVAHFTANGSRLSLQLPTHAPNLGEIVAASVCWLVDRQTSSSTSMMIDARWSHQHGAKLFAGWNTAEVDADVPEVTHLITDVNKGGFGSAYLITRFHPLAQKQPDKPGVIESTEAPSDFGWVSPWNFTHTDIGVNEPGLYGPHAGDVVFTNQTSGDIDLYTAWLDVVFRTQAGNILTKVSEGPGTQDIGERVPVDPRGGGLPGFIFPSTLLTQRTGTFRANFEGNEPSNYTGSGVFIGGEGPRDDGGGTYTGSAAAVVENPADVVGHLIAHYIHQTAFSLRATGSDFGSFDTARTLLNGFVSGVDWMTTTVLNKQQPLRNWFAHIGRQSRSFYQRQINVENEQIEWRAFVDLADPETDDPSRMWRTDGGKLTWNDLVADKFELRLTDLADIASAVTLRYGYHLPSRKWSATKYVRRDDNNFDSDGAAYQAACEATVAAYLQTAELTFDAPDVWRPEVAESLCKYYCDIRRERLVVVEFETYTSGVDIRPGHVIKFDDEIGDRMSWPGRTGTSAWSTHQFNVKEVTLISDPGEPIKVHVIAVETFTEAA